MQMHQQMQNLNSKANCMEAFSSSIYQRQVNLHTSIHQKHMHSQATEVSTLHEVACGSLGEKNESMISQSLKLTSHVKIWL